MHLNFKEARICKNKRKYSLQPNLYLKSFHLRFWNQESDGSEEFGPLFSKYTK